MLQPLLLPGKDGNPFSVHISPDKDTLEVYFGYALLERINNGKDSFQYKYLLARLYNAGFKQTTLRDVFGHAISTLRRWGNALKSGDAGAILKAFSGQGARQAVTQGIEDFIRSEFRRIYPQNKYTYSKVIKERVQEVFKIGLSSESLRKIFAKEKQLLKDETIDTGEIFLPLKQANSCECKRILNVNNESNRNNSLKTLLSVDNLFLHHIGIVLAFFLLHDLKIKNCSIEQWIYSVLLGKVNMEQMESLDYDSLEFILDHPVMRTARTQHMALKHLAIEEENRIQLFRINADSFCRQEYSYYYYDPHGVKYTGMKNILKGWCGSAGKITKVNYQDFFHTPEGFPIYFELNDNYTDMRERFIKSVEFFSTEIIKAKGKAFIIDRGIYGKEKMMRISENGYGLVTWEKGYKHDGWDEEKKKTKFKIVRCKNDSNDIRSWDITFIKDTSFNKIPQFYRLIVKIVPPGKNKKESEVSILTNGKLVDLEAVRAMFTRWIQENDFRNTVINFGLNQITSYDSEKYDDLKDTVTEHTILSDGYNVLRKALETARGKLGKELVKLASKTDKRTISMNSTASAIKIEVNKVEQEIGKMQRYETRLEKLIRKDNERLVGDKKSMLDAVKITARNIFYCLLKMFRPIYDNYRSDNKILRELIRSHGYLFVKGDRMDIRLDMERRLSPDQKRKIERFLGIVENEINHRNMFGKEITIAIYESSVRALP